MNLKRLLAAAWLFLGPNWACSDSTASSSPDEGRSPVGGSSNDRDPGTRPDGGGPMRGGEPDGGDRGPKDENEDAAESEAFGCEGPSDCSAGMTCATEAESGWPGGVCRQVCGADVEGTCPAGYQCFGWSPDDACSGTCETSDDCESGECKAGQCCVVAGCFRICSRDEECGRGEACLGGTCNAFCKSDDDCRASSCDPYTRLCKATGQQGGGLGAACAQHDQCRSGACFDGACATDCLPGEAEPCPEGGACVPLRNQDGTHAVHTCMPRCDGPGATCDNAELTCSLSPTEDWVCASPRARLCGQEVLELSEVGQRCECDAECADPNHVTCLTERQSGFPGGVCARSCTSETDCGGGFGCPDWGFCAERCETEQDCSVPSVCLNQHCLHMCQQDEDCDGGECNLYSGKCEPDPGPSRAGFWAPCSVGEECRSGTCSNGSCVASCSTERNACPEGAVCIPSNGTLGVCAVECEVPEDCPTGAGLGCLPLQEGGPQYCLPAG